MPGMRCTARQAACSDFVMALESSVRPVVLHTRRVPRGARRFGRCVLPVFALCLAWTQSDGVAAASRRQLEEAPPPGPAPDPPAYPTDRYIFNVTRLNNGLPLISNNVSNSSEFAYNFHPAWVHPAEPRFVFPPARHGVTVSRRRQLDEGPPPDPAPAPPDGLLLQVQAAGTGVTELVLVRRIVPANHSRSSMSARLRGAGGAIAFDVADKSKIVLSADGTEENFGVSNPSLFYREADQNFCLVYAASTRNNETYRVRKTLHLATTTTPDIASSWVRRGPIFQTYPLNVSETEFGTLLPRVQGGPHYLFFVTTTDNQGILAGLQVATTTNFTHFEHMQNFTLMLPRTQLFDSDGFIPGPTPEVLKQDGNMLFLYNGLRTNPGAGYPWTISVGWSVLNGSDPLEVLHRSNLPLLTPKESWERDGRVPNSVVLSGMSRVETNGDPNDPTDPESYWADQFIGCQSPVPAAKRFPVLATEVLVWL